MRGADPPQRPPASLLVAAVEFGGGLEELQLLLRSLSADTGMAFVCARHPDTAAGGRLAEQLSHHTQMPVVEVGPETAIEPNRIYVAAPGCWLSVEEGRVTSARLVGGAEERGGAVDRMLGSLARAFGPQAVGLVLTPAGADGRAGLRDIRRRGGMVIVRGHPAPEEREHALDAIERGVVDLVLDTPAMPRALERFARGGSADLTTWKQEAGEDCEPATGETSEAWRSPRQADAAPSFDSHAAEARMPEEDEGLDERSLARLMEVVGDAGSAALRTYKQDLIARRVRRRMGFAGMVDVHGYLDVLASDEDERRRLLDDLFISVTDFFRDPAAFHSLRSLVIEPLVSAATPGEKLRVWVPACATGEEAYSLGMEFLDAAREHGEEVALQIFATDVHQPALEHARAGRYDASIAGRVGASRLRLYFDAEGDGYRVRPLLRDVVSFGLHDVTADPPFSRMKLVSCRNLLIYLVPEVRDRVLRNLHAALDVGGYLVLGASESPGVEPEHLVTLSKEWRIYKKVGSHPPLSAAASGRPPPPTPPEREPTLEARGPARAHAGGGGQRPGPQGGPSMGDLARRAVLRVHVPPCIVVSDTGEVLFMHGELRPYLRFPDGDARLDLTSLLAPGLASRARAAVFRARREETTVTTYSSPDAESGARTRITVSLLPEIGSGAVALTFESVDEDAAPLPQPEPESAAQALVIDQLERELRAVQDELHGAVAELEATNEQLRVANEESTSVNEELRAANQDLEATSEELRTVNEELTRVNRELHAKIEQVETARDDLANFFTSTRVATLFLDEQLCIERATPEAQALLSLERDAMGRRLEELEHPLMESGLEADVRAVLRDLSDVSRELSLPDGRWFTRQVLPYRTAHNRIEGVVVTLSDITALKTATTRLAVRERQQAVIARLGLEALEDPDLQHFMDHAVREVCATIGTELCSVFELQPGGAVLLLRAGVGWPEGRVWQASVPAGLESHAGYAIKKDAAVVVRDFASEHRFRPAPLLVDEGVRSGVACVIRSGDDVPYGVLCAHARTPREFSPEDALFLQSAAAVVAAAVARDETRARLVLKNAVAEALADAVTLRDALTRFHESVARELGTVISEFWEPSEDAAVLERTFVHGLDPFDDNQVQAELPGEPIPLGEGFPGRIFGRTRAEWASSLQEPKRFYRVEAARGLGISSGLALPVVSGRAVRGVLTFFAQRRLNAGDTLLRTLESIGRSIGDFMQYLDVETRRTRMEAELRDSEAKFRQILVHSPVPKLVYDEAGTVVEASDSWTELSGYAVEELPTIGDWIRQAFEGADVADELVREAWGHAEGRRHVEVHLRTKTGELRILSVNLVALGAPSGGGARLMVLAAADVTDQRRSEEERAEASAQKDEFIAMLGHELRNPLAAVRSATELLQRARPEDALIQRTQAILDRQTTHMARLLDGLLDLSRIVRGRIVLERRLVDLGAMTRDAVRDYSVTMRDAGLDLVVDVPPDPMWIHADPVRLSQVTTNLLSNAIKFTPSPGTVTVRLSEEDGFGVLSVADTGNGIDPELLPKLFQPFRQAQQSLDRSLGGLGLGLSLVKTLVELHEGTVEAHSEGEGLGSEFIVRLPLTHHQPAASEGGEEREGSLRILIIEDNEDAAESLREILEFEGHETAVAAGGSRGIELAHKFDPDVVLCDLGLPDVNGFDVAVALREDPRTRDLYLVALSGYGRPEDKRRCREVGFDTHLTKPVLMRDLEAVLAQAVRPRPHGGRRRASRREGASSGAAGD